MEKLENEFIDKLQNITFQQFVRDPVTLQFEGIQ